MGPMGPAMGRRPVTLAAEGSQDQAVRRPRARASSGASDDEQLLAEGEKFEIAAGGRAPAEDQELD
jgi:hypothetical protein